jgi:hypothetical protein
MLLLLAWGAWSFVSVWRVGLPDARRRDNLLACAATLAPALLLAHSVVDYPLRTSALMAVFALAIVMVIAPVAPLAASTPSNEPPARESGETALEVTPDHQLSLDRAEQGRFVPAPPRGDWPAAWQPPRPPEQHQPPIGRDEPKRR